MRHAATALALASYLVSAPAHAQCSKDTDCKGDRICEAGQCVTPAQLLTEPFSTPSAPDPRSTLVMMSAPAVPLAAEQRSTAEAPHTLAAGVNAALPAQHDWFRGYGNITTTVIPSGWGGIGLSFGGESHEADLKMETAQGFELSGYRAINPHLHLGGFFSYSKEFDDSNMASGLSLKIGGRLGNNLFMSLVLNLGYSYQGVDADVGSQGIILSPRFQLDILTVRAGRFKWGLFVAQGMEIIPFFQGSYAIDGEDLEWSGWSVRPVLLIGTTFGG